MIKLWDTIKETKGYQEIFNKYSEINPETENIIRDTINLQDERFHTRIDIFRCFHWAGFMFYLGAAKEAELKFKFTSYDLLVLSCLYKAKDEKLIICRTNLQKLFISLGYKNTNGTVNSIRKLIKEGYIKEAGEAIIRKKRLFISDKGFYAISNLSYMLSIKFDFLQQSYLLNKIENIIR